MQVQQLAWDSAEGWGPGLGALPRAHLVLVFGARPVLAGDQVLRPLRSAYPDAVLAGCSTAGNIEGVRMREEGAFATVVAFDHAWVRSASRQIGGRDSVEVGRRLAEGLPAGDLRHVLLFSDGLHVNGSGLARGLSEALPEGVCATGGLAGDGDRFEDTLVVADDKACRDTVGVVGLYGGLRVGYGSLGGWDAFGPWRRVTRSEGNVLHELDGQPALELYRRYLGDQAGGLPATGLLFPLCLRDETGPELVRTILGIDEGTGSLVFAGDVPEGSRARLMRANFDRLVDGAQGAAEGSLDVLGSPAELALLVSCVGRRLVLKQRVEEELEAVRSVVGPQVVLTGFYSYGEICPSAPGAGCGLHNQTMTITTLRET